MTIPEEIQKKLHDYKEQTQKFPSEDSKRESLEKYIQKREQKIQQLISQRDDPTRTQIERDAIDEKINCILTNIDERLDPEPVEFVNRLEEHRFIVSTHYPYRYLLISAPSGYGKTKLLDVVREQLEDEGWLGIHVALNPKKSHTRTYSFDTLTKSILEKVAEIEHVKKQDQTGAYIPTDNVKIEENIAHLLLNPLKEDKTKGVLLTLDDVEVLNEMVVKKFFVQFLPKLYKKLNAIKRQGFRMILVGRYITELKHISDNMKFNVMTLNPFTFSTVQQTVSNFVEKKHYDDTSDKYVQELASHLMYLTGGHPKAMAKILKEFPFPFSPGFLLDNESSYYEKYLEEIITNIKTHIDSDLFDVLSRLSVVRRFNTGFLTTLIEDEVIPGFRSADRLESVLTNTYMVDREDTGFLKDAITQRLLAIRLRRLEPELFKTVCRKSIEFYASELKKTLYRPDIYAVELLFQKLQLFFYQQSGNKDKFFEQVPDILTTLLRGRDESRDQVYNGFKTLLKKDWELRFNINYLLCQRHYSGEQTFNELINKMDEQYKEMKRS